MDREALNDYPMGRYDVRCSITAFEPDREIAWTVLGQIEPPLGHVYGYRLEPTDGGTLVTSYYDWSATEPELAGSRHLPGDLRGRARGRRSGSSSAPSCAVRATRSRIGHPGCRAGHGALLRWPARATGDACPASEPPSTGPGPPCSS